MTHQLFHGDCLQIMPRLPDKSVNMVFADLPYGTTYAPWDSVISLPHLWAEYERLCRPDAAIVLTASQPFASQLVSSKPSWFRCEWVWDKVNGANFANANRQPLKVHESVLVFSAKQPFYSPQKTPGPRNHVQGASRANIAETRRIKDRVRDDLSGMKFPKSIVVVPKHSSQSRHHPTEKPVALADYFIRTYSRPGDTVLDNTMGAGGTGVAAVALGRHFVGIEKERRFYDIAEQRVMAAETESLERMLA